MQTTLLATQLFNFFIFPKLMTFITAVIDIYFSNFGQPFYTLKFWPRPVFKVKITILTSTPVLESSSRRDLFVYDVWRQNSYGKFLKYDVKVLCLAPPSGWTFAEIGNQSADFYSSDWVPWGHVYVLYAVATMPLRYSRSKNGWNRRTWCGNTRVLS